MRGYGKEALPVAGGAQTEERGARVHSRAANRVWVQGQMVYVIHPPAEGEGSGSANRGTKAVCPSHAKFSV